MNENPEGPFKLCPRCLDECLECLAEHSHCFNCLYSPQLKTVSAAMPSRSSTRKLLKRLKAPEFSLFDNPETCTI